MLCQIRRWNTFSDIRSHNRARRPDVLGRIRTRPWYGTNFLFLEQIAPSWRHISVRIHARVGGARVDVVTLPDQNWEWRDSLADFSERWQGKRRGIKSMSLKCSFMLWPNRESEFFMVGNKISILRCEWVILYLLALVEHVSFCHCTERKAVKENCLLQDRVNLRVSQTMLNHIQDPFW